MENKLLDVTNLTVEFGGLTALSGLDFQLREGELLGLIGPNGSGKTTCFNAITGIYKPSKGSVVLLTKDITGLNSQKIYKSGITRTFQRLRLAVGLSVFDNLVIGDTVDLNTSVLFNLLKRKALRKQVDYQLNKVKNILKIFNPDLVNAIYEPISKLTMIDRRRVEVCRALISRPRVLLLDEPSAGMTSEETREFMDDLLEIKKKTPSLGIILIEHEMSVIQRVTDRCVVLNYGKKIAEGTYKAISCSRDVRVAYLGED